MPVHFSVPKPIHHFKLKSHASSTEWQRVSFYITHTAVNSLISQLVNNAIKKKKGRENVGEGGISILNRVVNEEV